MGKFTVELSDKQTQQLTAAYHAERRSTDQIIASALSAYFATVHAAKPAGDLLSLVDVKPFDDYAVVMDQMTKRYYVRRQRKINGELQVSYVGDFSWPTQAAASKVKNVLIKEEGRARWEYWNGESQRVNGELNEAAVVS